MKKLIAIVLCSFLVMTSAACGGGTGSGDTGTLTGSVTQTDFTTGFRRTTGKEDSGDAFQATEQYSDKIVGIFYFLWLSQAAVDTTVDDFIENGTVEMTLTGETVSKAPTFTWWGEPMYGYYQVEDEWVVRKHIELFINAGLDFICFDTTNNDYYNAATTTVLDVLLEYQELGYDVPKAMFMTNSDSSGMITSLYSAYYRRDKYDSIWFTGNGDKPWIIGTYTGTNSAISERFYFKRAQWPTNAFDESRFPWMSWRYPQEVYKDDAQGYRITNVSVSQHTGIGGGRSDVNVSGINFSLSGMFAPYNYETLSDALKARVSAEQATKYYNYNWGRGYSHATGSNSYEDALKNVNFEEQWQSAHDNDEINLVFITGWNEWIAQKQSKDPLLGDDYGYFVDTFSMEFSRDVEMMAGGYLDNCFLQMVRNIREYKGVGSVTNDQSYVGEEVDLYDLANWQDIVAYADLVYETEPRNHSGAGSNYYRNDTGRNDIKEVRVATKNDDVYFLISTVDPITEKDAADSSWMNLWIGIEGQTGGWNGLQYVINRSLDGQTASVDKIADGAYQRVGECTVSVSGSYMLVKVRKSVLGITEKGFGLQFKVTDHLQSDFDITDLYTNGDAAPIGRINYSYYVR